MGCLRQFFSPKKIRSFLSKRKWYGLDYLLAAVLGAVTPFCSCSSITLFIGFLQASIPLGVSFSFLITSPLVNEVALALFIGLFGFKITLFYLIAGIFIGILGGFILGKIGSDKHINSSLFESEGNIYSKKSNLKDFFRSVSKNAFKIVRQVAPYILIGLVVGSIMHGYVPDNYFAEFLSKNNWLAVPLAVILAVPLYANTTSVIPIVQALVFKGMALGTALAFMMAVVGLSLPEAMMLKKVIKARLLLIFFTLVTLGIIAIGYLFNFLILV